ncbi:MAG: DUF3052 family protein [Proteobacteria bacterium]|nr:DUF3052 family protein [Pseudomonadota bacterium]
MAARGSAGYSGTPLPTKLGIKPGHRMLLLDAPNDYKAHVAPMPAGVRFMDRADATIDIVHAFVTDRTALGKLLPNLLKQLKPDAMIWISWPKKSSGVATTITEDVIRDVALPLGLVDVKVCAVTDVWSGLKLVVRKELR